MDIDLSNRNVSELYFDKGAMTEEEAAATAVVRSLSVARNQITRIRGLDVAFTNLTKLDFSHNILGANTTPVSACLAIAQRESAAVNGHAYCKGVATWIEALPPTLESLDISHNQLTSFVCCSCIANDGALSGPTVVAPTLSELYNRYLRHACPLTLSLFFNRSHFPKLRHLNLSHNALTVSVAESDAMEDLWQDAFQQTPQVGLTDHTCAVENLIISYNARLASVNCFLLNSCTSESNGGLSLPSLQSFPLHTLSLRGCGVSNLVGLSGVYPSAPRLERLELDESPIKRTILASNHAVVANVIESLLLLASVGADSHQFGYESEGLGSIPSYQNVVLCKAVQDLTQNHCDVFMESLQKHLDSLTSGKHSIDFGSCIYASVLLEVIPSLKLLDEHLHVVECKEAIINATRSALVMLSTARDAQRSESVSQPKTALTKQTTAPDDDETRFGEGLHRVASRVIPQLHTRVLIGGLPSSQDEENTTPVFERSQEALAVREQSVGAEQEECAVKESDCFTPIHLRNANREAYKALCQRAQELKDELAESQKRCRSFTEHSKHLQSQLVVDRRHIADQHKEILRLRSERDLTQASIFALKKRLNKRRHELAYGVQAIESRFSAMREQAAMSQIQQREKALEKRERKLQKRIALAASSSARSDRRSLHENPRQVRSVVLREAAVQRKLSERKSEDPLTFSTSRFHIDDGGACGGRAGREAIAAVEEGDAEGDASYHYLRSYPQEMERETQRAARRYCRSISPDQRRQLREAVRLAAAAPSTATDAKGEVPPERDEASASVRDFTEQDLSTLSLTELFEAAAAIRHRQLVLQQNNAQTSKEANDLFPDKKLIASEDFIAAVSCFKQRDHSSPVIDHLRGVAEHRCTASDDPVTLQSAKHGDSTFLNTLERIEVPSSVSLGGDDDVESGAVDALDSLNLFEGDESIETHPFPLKAKHSISLPADLISVKRSLF